MGSDTSSTGDNSSETGAGPTSDPTVIDPSMDSSTGSESRTTTSADSTSSADGTSSTTEDTTEDTTGPACMADEVECGGECIDPATSSDHCGASDDCRGESAGVDCGEEQQCVGGLCECLVGVSCDGECIDPQTDPLFCGASGDCLGPDSGQECLLTAQCLDGACVDTCDNCGFETGNFAEWTIVDLTGPYLPLDVNMGGYMDANILSFTTTPTEGSFCAVTGFDGDGPGTIEIGQDVTLAAAPPADLLFDYRAAWDLLNFGATMDRTLEVHIEPAGGGMPMDVIPVLTAPTGDLTVDTGELVGMVDLGAYAGQTIFVNFVFTVPENFSGPALAQLDNVRVVPQ